MCSLVLLHIVNVAFLCLSPSPSSPSPPFSLSLLPRFLQRLIVPRARRPRDMLGRAPIAIRAFNFRGSNAPWYANLVQAYNEQQRARGHRRGQV